MTSKQSNKKPKAPEIKEGKVLEAKDLQRLLDVLLSKGYAVVGPTVRDQAIVYSPLKSVEELPVGWTDEQAGGSYRLKKRKDGAFFGYVVGPQSWKQFFHPPQITLWRARRKGEEFDICEDGSEVPKLALLGARPCEIQAIRVQDKVFLEGPFVDPYYRARREGAFIVAVHCVKPGGTCFCASMNTGPRALDGFDLALTEMVEKDRHWLLAEAGTPAGAEVLAELPCAGAGENDLEAAGNALRSAAARMGRTIDTSGLKNLLYKNLEHPRWDHVAGRCLACANCTMVCPTCFCTTAEEVTDLAGTDARRVRKWDSCFSMEFSYIFGGHIRRTARARYRQWMTHKLATWEDQFGTLGCVGCGRCIAWCPVGIDITEEAQAIRDTKL